MCGRYGFSVWLIWFSVVADIVLLWPILLWPIWFVANMVAPRQVNPPGDVSLTPSDCVNAGIKIDKGVYNLDLMAENTNLGQRLMWSSVA